MLGFSATSRLSWCSLCIVLTGCNKWTGMWFPLDVVCLSHCNQQWLKVTDKALPSLHHVLPRTDDIFPGQERFWQSFDISQPAWCCSTFLMWSHRQKSSSTSPTERTSPVSGLFFICGSWHFLKPEAEKSVMLRILRNGICEACFAIQMSVKGEILKLQDIALN